MSISHRLDSSSVFVEQVEPIMIIIKVFLNALLVEPLIK